MKNLFPGYYQPSKEEFKKLWDECVFIFDTNVLLDIYRYLPDTSKTIIEILEMISHRIWLPYQFAEEYHRRLYEFAYSLPDEYRNVKKALTDIPNQLKNQLNQLQGRTKSAIDIDSITLKLSALCQEISEEVSIQENEHKNHLTVENIVDKISQIFDGRTGEKYSETDIQRIKKLGETRYQSKQPPGYKDSVKKSDNEYGDLIGWFQMIAYAKSEKKPIVFVTRDKKEDWFLQINGKHQPRPELINEMRHEAGVSFYMYTTDQFLKYAREYLDSKVTDEAIEETQNLASHDLERDLTGFEAALAMEKSNKAAIAAKILAALDTQKMAASATDRVRNDIAATALETTIARDWVKNEATIAANILANTSPHPSALTEITKAFDVHSGLGATINLAQKIGITANPSVLGELMKPIDIHSGLGAAIALAQKIGVATYPSALVGIAKAVELEATLREKQSIKNAIHDQSTSEANKHIAENKTE